MKIFLTGGSGFIGRNIIDQMGDGYEIIAPRHNELELLDAEAVRAFLARYRFDAVIHSAVKPGHRNAADHTRLLEANLRMLFNITRNRDFFGKLIFLSSGAVYDITKPMCRVREDDFDRIVPGDEHGFSKYIISKHLAALDNAVELRIFGVFGKYEDYAIRFISNAICKTLFDLPITLRQDRIFDYIFIDDLMPVLKFILNTNVRYKEYNMTPDSSVRLLELANTIRKISGKDLQVQLGKPGMGLEYSGDNQRLKQEMPYLSFTPLDMAVRKLYGWYAENKNSIEKEKLLIDK